MSEELNYFAGISWPRSGHHLLVRILSAYFGNKFGYCEYYTPVDCCKTVPCTRAGVINFSKNHDYKSSVPVLNGNNYLVQYREFCPSVISNFELFVRRTKKDSFDSFRRFSLNQVRNYVIFMKRWTYASPENAIFIRLSYEKLTRFPAESVESVVKLFATDLPVNQTKLERSIDCAERITVQDGGEIADRRKGVIPARDIRSFRYYDEPLFRTLEQQTRAAYDEMAGLPLVTRTAARRAVRHEKSPRLYVDATGMLAIAGVVPTGIPRVQGFLIRHAIEDPDPNISVVLYDPPTQGFRFLGEREISRLTPQQWPAPPGTPHVFRESLRRARENPWLGKEFDRTSAAQITGSHEGGGRYSLVKNSIRAYRYYRRALEWKSWFVRSRGSACDPRDGTLLMSHTLVTGSHFSAGILASRRRAFVCHDLIPWLHPEYMSDRSRANRLTQQLKLLLETGAHVLCTSDTSRAMLREFVAEIGKPEVQIDQFALPSILFETAEFLGKTARLKPEPFVLYCSTIEARKNHLLLAKIWKRAHDEGVPLPKLICVGKWGWGVQELRHYLDAHPFLKESIEFRGPVDDVELIDLYRRALFGVVPSYVEGWGYGASECLDFGLPVIVSTAPGLREAVRDLMPSIDPNDESAWLAVIRRLATTESELEELRCRIANQYRPINSQVSWNAIKTAFGIAV